ncbi:DNA cytosine methyltransferase [Chitinibacter sp. FCG-7]|uniref:Cytosine-specific methyltransferase n=1 Tax=Chitinibacter mangrovi TaxID=3153927 RepID=A0AAU7FB90_9NEIS
MKLVDFFSGAGGLSSGLNQAGFNSILGSDIHPVYANTYQINHPNAKVITRDIRTLTDDDIFSLTGLKVGELDLIAGGPPCQGFSVNAPIRSLDDQRNHLFKDYLRIADSLRPKAILIENVPGLLSLGKGSVVEAIYKELTNMGYSVAHKVLFAGHYGVPQMRFRTIFIALRDGGKIEFPEPTHDASAIANFGGAKEHCIKLSPLFAAQLKRKTTVSDALSDLPALSLGQAIHDIDYPILPQSEFQSILRADSSRIYNHACAKLGKVNLERLKHIPQGGSWRDIPHDLLPAGLQRARRSDHTKRYGRLHPDELCSTILTKCDPHWGSFFHPNQDRALSVREAARIQSFPDNFIFTGSLTEQFEQVGNAVPALMAKSIGETIKKLIS